MSPTKSHHRRSSSHQHHNHNTNNTSNPAPPTSLTPPKNPNPNPSSNPQRKTHTWLLTHTGTHHFAKNRSSFKSYHRAPTKIGASKILGIGTVELTVRAGPQECENRPNRLVLEDVLHIPGARCNGLCLGRWREGNPGCDVEVLDGGEGCRCRCWRVGEGGDGSGDGDEDAEEGEVGEDGREYGHGHGHEHGEALWYGEGCRGGSRVVLWGDRAWSKDEGLDELGGVDVRGVDASAEEMDTLYTRVRERSLI
ncbi:hypothetical protein BJX70DRAFT_397810 [Aspergillus crustosus]